MKPGKRGLILILLLPALLILAGIIISLTYENAVIKALKKYLDKHLTTEIEVSHINFSAFKKFPNATVEFRNIVARSGIAFSSGDFANIDTDTLLSAKSVFFEFSLPGVIRGDYKLKNIQIIYGNVLLLTDKKGNNNFSVWEYDKSQIKEALNISLQNITLTNSIVRCVDMANNYSFDLDTRRFNIRADFSDSYNHLSGKGELYVNKLTVGESYELAHQQLKADIHLDYTKNKYLFSESVISFGKSSITFQGELNNLRHTTVAFKFSGKGANINDLADFYPGQLTSVRKDYLLSGLVEFHGNINGTLSEKLTPKIDISYNLVNGSVTNRLNRKKISHLLIKGDFTNGDKRTLATTLLNIKEFKASQAKSTFNGAIKILDFDRSTVELILKSEIQAGEFFKFLNIDTLEQVSGTISTDIFVKGQLTSLKNLKKDEVISLYKEGPITLNDFTFKFIGSRKVFTKANGSITLGDIVKVRDISFKVFENDFRIDCNLSNLTEFLFYKDILYAEVTLHSGFLDIKTLIEKNSTESSGKAFDFPERIYFKSQFKIDKLVYGKFTADNIAGTVTYKPQVFDFEQFQLESVEGMVTGSAKVSQNPEKHIKIDCSSKLNNLNIHELFVSMNNFGQDVILEKNLKGKISGSLNFSTVWDENLDIQGGSVLANSKFEIRNGELLNYAPMMGLSKYVDLEELKDIKFNTLKNQIFIKDKVITIPEMDIHSSAFNIRGMGVHKFDNSYDYRIQLELTELLARKAKKKRKEIEEFGTVQDDGLGRLNIPIKIEGKGNIYHAELDRKRALEGFKKNIAQEREEFKNLFNGDKTTDKDKKNIDSQNKEFIIEWDDGNDKKDFIFEKNNRVKNKQPQFIIEWDDEDSPDLKDTTQVRIN